MIFLGNEQLLDQNYRVTLSLNNINGQVTTVQGNLQSDLTIGGGNDFGDGLDLADAAGIFSSGAAQAINSVVGTARGIRKTFTGRDIVNVWETEAVWKGSNRPTFELDLTFLCLGTTGDIAQKTDVITRVNSLMRAVYPDMSGSGAVTRVFTPPLGYTRKDTDLGKVTLRIGNWFYAKRLVAEACSFTYSKETNRLGKPMYATGRVVLRPYRGISYKEFQKYFVG
jgi:hypothetical protein